MHADLQAMLAQIEAIKAEGRAVAAGLTDDRLNWHPAEGSWSILDCLEHLNVAVTKTLPAFDRSIAEGRAKGADVGWAFPLRLVRAHDRIIHGAPAQVPHARSQVDSRRPGHDAPQRGGPSGVCQGSGSARRAGAPGERPGSRARPADLAG